MTITTAPRRAVNAKSADRPLDIRLTIYIRGTAYSVTPIDPGPDNAKAYRLEKLGGGREVYDLARTNGGLVVCDCPSYVATHEGTAGTCKHGASLVLVGLFEAPSPVAAVIPEPPKSSPYAGHLAKLDAIAAAEDALRREGGAAHGGDDHADVSPAFDPEPYRIANVVARGDACWINQGPKGGPTTPCWAASNPARAKPVDGATSEPRELRLVDDDGTPLETPSEIDRRHRDERLAAHAVASGQAEWLEGRPVEATCCDPAEPSPCAACLDPTRGRPDASPATLAEFLDAQAARHREMGGAAHGWLAGKIAELAERARFLGASTPEDFDDRTAAMLDAATR